MRAPPARREAEERGGRARQNGDMAHPHRLLRAAAGLAVLALGAACQSSALTRGDAAFRSGDYLGAWHAYAEAGDGAAAPELEQRRARTHWFLIEDGLRDRLSSGREEEALALIEQIAPQAPPDRSAALEELAQRGRDQLGARHTRDAEELLEAGDPDAAVRELTLALSWNPADDLAANLLEMTTERLARERDLGDSFYFEGMDHLRHGSDVRARTSFHHAGALLGPESRAQERFDALTQDLAASGRAEARNFLDADMLGPAFFAIRGVERLEPEHAETLALIERLQAKVSSENGLLAADLAIRGDRTALAGEILAELRAWDVPAHRAERTDLERRNQEAILDHDYRFARALELDEQIVRAAEVYRTIVARSEGFGWADSELRMAQTAQRVQRAEIAYRRALAAEAAGDLAGYRAGLEETVRAASDYQDALARLAALLAAPAASAD